VKQVAVILLEIVIFLLEILLEDRHPMELDNIFIGSCAGCNNGGGNNSIAIGRNAGTTGNTPGGLVNITASCDSVIVMGNSFHTTACIQISWGVASDIRDKCVYGNVPHGRDFLRGVNPIKYSFKDRETNEVTDDRVRYGFSAQEVLALEGEEPILLLRIVTLINLVSLTIT
jgi:hypothetical protein